MAGSRREHGPGTSTFSTIFPEFGYQKSIFEIFTDKEKSQILRTTLLVDVQIIMWISSCTHVCVLGYMFIIPYWSPSESQSDFLSLSLKSDYFSETFICWIWMQKLGHWVLWQTYKIKSQPEVHYVSFNSDKLQESYGNERKKMNLVIIPFETYDMRKVC